MSAIAPDAPHRSPYTRRRDTVVGVIVEHTAMDRDAAEILARDVLQALDHLPETVR